MSLGNADATPPAFSTSSVPLRVVQAVWGKFHHFDLARQLHVRGMLEAVFTTYPPFKLQQEEIPEAKIRCRWRWHAPLLALWRYGAGLGPLEPWWLRRTDADFVAWVARCVPECDVFIGLAGTGLEAGRKVQNSGGIYICDRGSSHIRWTDDLLAGEFKRWGESYQRTAPVFVEKEEKEYALADLVTVPSEFARRSYLEMGLEPDRVQNVALGVNRARFNRVCEPRKGSFNVLFVGQVSFQKGVPYLLQAFNLLRHPAKRLTIIGAMRPEMRRWLSGRRFDGVTFAGALPQEKLKRHMSESHVHVLPSIQDGFGMVVTEAMACGCAQIVSSNCGAADLIVNGREGFVVPARNEQAILRRLQELADDPALCEKMGANALDRIKRLGGWDSYGAAMESLITKAWSTRR